jgi:hypothetical protein
MNGNPQIAQGILNKVITNVVVPGFPLLSVSAPFMAKSQAVLTFDGAAVNQLATATGIVQSPEPYVPANLMVNILRSQAIVNAYVAQWQTGAILGAVEVYGDVSSLAPFSLSQCAITNIEPGPFDGGDPTTKITIKGIMLVNATMWLGNPT